jgi:hypothetical protein
MRFTSWLAGLAGAVTLSLVAIPADAAPAVGPNAMQGAAQTTDVQQAHWRDRRHGYRSYHYGPRWRHGYRHYGYRPGFRFHYGPRYHRRHWHDRRW